MEIMSKKKFVFIIIALISISLLIVIRRGSIIGLEKVKEIEQLTISKYSSDGILKDGNDRICYLDEMESYLSSNKNTLFILHISRNPDSISIQFYSGVHYLISPSTKGMK